VDAFQSDDFISLETTRAWLTQFKPADIEAALWLLQSLKLVSASDFAREITALLLAIRDQSRSPIALYVEREIPKWKSVPNRLFKESRTRIKRAAGSGPPPIRATRAYDPKVGSEGIVAQLISELAKRNPRDFLVSPGPDAIRKHRVRRMVVVTDFIGSGSRVLDFLGAAWRVRSVRSWWSARRKTGLDIAVAAYAATDAGREIIERHVSKPTLYVADTVATLDSPSENNRISAIRDLCKNYAPPLPGRIGPFGFAAMNALGVDGSGALIAFAHGIPNNAPKLLFGTGRGWRPLFPSRTTTDSRDTFGRLPTKADVRRRLEDLGQDRLAKSHAISGGMEKRQQTLLVLAALGRSPRFDAVISARTGMNIRKVQEVIALGVTNGLIDANRRVTDVGRSEIAYARKKTPVRKQGLSFRASDTYYPKELRAPVKVSS
jgi:hypothetical protein